MSTVQRIAKNTIVLIVASIVGMIAGFFFTMYVARYLGAEGFGILSFAIAFTSMFGILTDIGLQTLIIREVARDKSLTAKYLGNITALKVILCIATFGAIALTINLLHYPPETIKVVYLIALSTIFGTFNTMLFSLFQAYERMEFVSLGQILTSILLLSGALFAINRDLGVIGMAYVYALASVVSVLYSSVISIWKFPRPRIEIDLDFWKQALKQAWPFGLAGVFATLYYWVDSLMLSAMKGDEAIGWYNAAYRLVLVLPFIPAAYFSAVFPVMSRFHISSRESLRFIYERSFKYMLTLAVPIGVGTTLLANKIILLIFGSGYSPSIVALQILVWSMAFIFISSVFGQLFNSVNKQLIVTWIVISTTVLNVILNLILIPRYSLTGASIATVASQFVSFAMCYFWSAKIGYSLSGRNLARMVARVLISSAIMCVFVLYLKNFYMLAVIALSALLYFAVLYIIGGIDKEDKLLFRQLVGRQQVADAVKKDTKSS